MNNSILLPCPFCGGKPYLERCSRGFINAQSTKIAYVRCLQCNARSKRVPLSDYGKTSHSAEAERVVINAWNSRTKKEVESNDKNNER